MSNKEAKMGVHKTITHCHPEFISGSLRCNNEMLNQVQHDLVKGFTLIELLVVVLIIGILASVALPQYNKAVRKARFSEVVTTFNTISKGIDMWLLENDGFPSTQLALSGENGEASLDIEKLCDSTDSSNNCFTKIGRWSYWCSPSICAINFDSRRNADGSYGNRWLNESYMSWGKREANGSWTMEATGIDSSFLPEVCRWWKGSYGDKKVVGPYGDISSECDAY